MWKRKIAYMGSGSLLFMDQNTLHPFNSRNRQHIKYSHNFGFKLNGGVKGQEKKCPSMHLPIHPIQTRK
jgi:hypothetical protein